MTGAAERFLWRSESLGVALVDGAGRIAESSPTLQRLSSRAAAGRSAVELVVPAQRDAFLELLRRAGDDWTSLRVTLPVGGGSRDFRAWVARAAAEVLLVLEPLWHDVAEVNAELLELNTDLVAMERELRRRGEALAEQNEQLRELDRLKEEFIALVSHEFRTPLASMRGYLELLAEDASGLDERARRYVGTLERNVERLLRLVDDLLFVVQLDAGALELELEPVDLAALVDDCAQAAAPAAEAKGVTLDARADGRPSIRGDRARLAQLVDNLLTNAIKFTPAGGRVELAVGAGAEGPVLRVSDTGVGIPESERGRIFDRFYRVPGDERRATQGTGLGLAVVRAIADAHGAAVEVEGAPGAGTSVRVALGAAAEGGAA